ncbi:MAG TPA: hypothetical protein PLC74_10525 [Acetobacteraceae bacterium]|nr:hypothetical protein [Acetobacteraceae bacterium]
MSQTVTVIGGVNNTGSTGVVSIPVGLSSSQAAGIQSVLTNISNSIAASGTGLDNINVAGQTGSVSGASIAGSSGVFELTNTGSTGITQAGSASVQTTVPAGYSTIVVQAPGAETVTGNGASSITAVFGSQSNVTFISPAGDNAASGTILGSGGDLLALRAGNYTVSLTGSNNNVIVGTGSDTINVTGTGAVNAFVGPKFAGTISFISSSTSASTVTGVAGNVVAFGSVGGGSFEGGTGGPNALFGGSGVVTLIGAGSNSYLEAGYGNTSVSGDVLFAGSGNSTLVADAGATNTILTAGSGFDSLVSNSTGLTNFFGGSGSATMTGSTVAGAQNVYFFVSNADPAKTFSGGSDVITNFTVGTDTLAASGAGLNIASITAGQVSGQNAAIVSLSDGTSIKLLGVTSQQVQSLQGSVGTGIIV